MFLCPSGNRGQNVVGRVAVCEVKILVLKHLEHRTSVRVNETGEHEFSFEIDQAGILACDRVHFRKIADTEDCLVFDGNRVRPRKFGILRKNVPIMKNRVCCDRFFEKAKSHSLPPPKDS